MNLATKARLVWHVAHWLATRNRYDTRYRFTLPDNPKFMGPREAVALIPDGAVVAASGLGGNQWASIIYWAMRDVYRETLHPARLTIVSAGGQGARGLTPGSLEELGVAGLCTRLFTGHVETFKSIVKLAAAGQLELQCLPQGVLALLIDGQTRGEDSLLTTTGVGTFVDPRVGCGTPVAGTGIEQWVAVEDGKLRFRIPRIDVAVFNAPAADAEGNIYVKHCAMIGESREIAKAAKRKNGIVIANVANVVEKGCDEVFLPARDIDAVVVHPGTEQAGSIQHRKYWPMFTTESDVSIREGLDRLWFLKKILALTKRRTPVDHALARLAAAVFAEHARKGSLVNIGLGLPEEVCRMIFEAGLIGDITLFTESGVIGGVPTAGGFFGLAVCPERVVSSAEIFKLCHERLNVSILGMLQADSDGNVNVSKRGDGVMNYVGPGGFIDFSSAAKTVIFVSAWMHRGAMTLDGERLTIDRPGAPKFVDRVDEITFCGREALARGQRVFYVTNVGVFQLTPRGMELIRVAPGVDIRRDVLDIARLRVITPQSGEIPRVAPSIMTGEGFQLRLTSIGEGSNPTASVVNRQCGRF